MTPNKEKKDSYLKNDNNLNRNSTKKNIQMANKHMKRIWTSLVTSEIPIKPTMRYQSTPTRMDKTKKTKMHPSLSKNTGIHILLVGDTGTGETGTYILPVGR